MHHLPIFGSLFTQLPYMLGKVSTPTLRVYVPNRKSREEKMLWSAGTAFEIKVLLMKL